MSKRHSFTKTTTELNSSKQLRIIGGRWRGRKIRFLPLPGLRPTPDRIRETLFNWLAPVIHEAHCLDLFAGSGALGFEALSRGAQKVTLIDQSAKVISVLRENAAHLNTNAIELHCAAFPHGLEHLPLNAFDIVFLDPPFHQQWIAACCQWLQQHHCLKANAFIYIEAEAELQPLPIPDHWQIIHSKKAGAVGYHLIKCL